MRYKIIVTEQAEEHLDSIIHYVLFTLNNKQAASNILDDVEKAYQVLENMAEGMQICTDPYLAAKQYRKIKLQNHDYVILYQLKNHCVYISGIFHTLENYIEKL